MTRRLSGLDSSFLYAESPTMPLHGGSITILDPSAARGEFGIDQVRRDIASRVDQLVPFRLRVAAPVLGLGRPVWVDTAGLDLDRHIHAAAVPRPGTRRQLADLAGELFARPLPRDRPLWQLWFVEGLEDGRVALIWKAHHALMGGVEVTNLLELLYDLDDSVARETASTVDLDRQVPSPLTMVARAAVDVSTVPVRVARLVGESARAAVRVSRFLLGGGRPASTLPFAGPRTSLNGALVADRTCAFTSLSLDDVKTVKNALGVKVNDVVLAVCGAALREYLDDRRELPSRSLNATVMAAVGGIGAHAGAVLGNATSILGATLATDVSDPLERLRQISASTQTAKGLHQALGDTMVMRLADALPPGIFGAVVRAYGATGLPSLLRPPFNAVISNVPGPPVALYSSGARVVACYLFGPLVQSVALDITVISYSGSLDVGIAASPNLVPDPWPIADAMPVALESLVAAVMQETRPKEPAGTGPVRRSRKRSSQTGQDPGRSDRGLRP
jgi:WS/DGAT/MGAT family acyltransferase